jgi:hypothetical protein
MLDMSNRCYESYYGQRGLQLFYENGWKTFERKLMTWSSIIFMPFDGLSNVAYCSTHCVWKWVSTFKAKKNEKKRKRFEIGKSKPQM